MQPSNMDACRGPRRSPSVSSPPAGLLLPLLAPLLILLLLQACHYAAAAATTDASPAPLPELDKAVHTFICNTHGCTTKSDSAVPALCTTPGTVLVYDPGACFHAATAHAGFQPFDLGTCSGGETIFCKQVLNLLNASGYSFMQTRSLQVLEACVLAGREKDVDHVLFVHSASAWKTLASDEMLMKGHIIRQPFRQECLISMTLWGTAQPFILWPGDLRYYLTSFPARGNSYVLMSKPTHCPTSRTFRRPRLPPYGVMFEKYKVLPWKVNRTDPFSHNATFWAELHKRIHLVVLDCNDALTEKLQWGPDYRQRVTCWKDSPLSQEFSYHDMMMGATFFLGLGATWLSPTPVDLNYCRVPIIMPPYQHGFIHRYARPKEYYPVTSAEQVLAAVDDILASCKVDFVTGADGAVTRTSTCFHDPPSLDAPMDMEGLKERFQRMMKARSIPCINRYRTVVPPPVTATAAAGAAVGAAVGAGMGAVGTNG